MPDEVKFVVGGPVQAADGLYLKRPADDELFTACQNGELSYVLASRQIGKSSLMYETGKRLRKDGKKVVVIDLNEIGHPENADSWYFSLLRMLVRSLNLELELKTWWKEEKLSTLPHRFSQFLREIVLSQVAEPIIIFIDEIDVTLGLDFTDDFFAAIRAIYQGRVQHPEYKRLTFVLLGVATPNQLIADTVRTPFNIGQRIVLNDFAKEKYSKFQEALEAKHPRYGRKYFDRIYHWTCGHPYLTQKLTEAVFKSSTGQQTNLVDEWVTKLFEEVGTSSDPNLQFVQSRVMDDLYAKEMLATYKQLLDSHTPVYDEETSAAISSLKLYGIVVARQGMLQIRNELYKKVFNKMWVVTKLEETQHKLATELQKELAQIKSKLAKTQQQHKLATELQQELAQVKSKLAKTQQQLNRRKTFDKIAFPIAIIALLFGYLGWYFIFSYG